MACYHRSFGDILTLKGYYYQTVHLYQHELSGSLYIEELRHHRDLSATNLMSTNNMQMMIKSFRPPKVYTGFSHDHKYRNDVIVGGFWLWEPETDSFSHIGMDDSDLLMYLTRDVFL